MTNAEEKLRVHLINLFFFFFFLERKKIVVFCPFVPPLQLIHIKKVGKFTGKKMFSFFFLIFFFVLSLTKGLIIGECVLRESEAYSSFRFPFVCLFVCFVFFVFCFFVFFYTSVHNDIFVLFCFFFKFPTPFFSVYSNNKSIY